MELELRQETVRHWETVCRTVLEQEETAEMIVPDACPDIWQVLDGEGRLLLQRKEPQEGKAECSGLLKVTILYQPEGEGGVQSMEVTLPFSVSPEIAGMTRRSALHVSPRVLSVDIHLLNPRKVLVRVGYSLALEGFEPRVQSLASLVEDPESCGIRQKTGTLGSLVTINAQEKSFTYQDVLALPAGRPDVAALLRTRADCTCLEARVIGTKLVFKGEAMVKLLCRGTDGSLFPVEFPLPYSQIMDAGEDAEDSLCHMTLAFTEVSCSLTEGDPRSFQASLTIQAQAVLRKQVEVPVLTDLYSTSYELQTEEVNCPVWKMMGQGEDQEGVRDVVETGQGPGELLDVQVRLGRSGQNREGQDLILTQEVEMVLLYNTQEGPASASRRVTVSHRLPGQGEGTCLFTSEVLRAPSAASTGSGMEVSFPLAFRWMTLRKGETGIIGRVTPGEKRAVTQEEPSVILRAVRPGEDLWDVAKACLSTDGEIMEASGLTSGELYLGQMLLIPRKVR
ncbi:MAG: DUF3794 domain-containing protein [Evtepia sp.]|uniref:DUF3794 and LysM peptidoglycan-binding domain-containing protein n=1 Tax=Evtepia sp. TaxID=2773933 RepID=UPI002A749458|nr:SPOCS domain-containing protein [Evtepia sp.]MDY3015143.1 DUF3794 domain-containing protein [Evtepia sp.]